MVEAFSERREVRATAGEDERVDKLAVFVDQVLGDRGRGEAGPADGYHALTRLSVRFARDAHIHEQPASQFTSEAFQDSFPQVPYGVRIPLAPSGMCSSKS